VQTYVQGVESPPECTEILCCVPLEPDRIVVALAFESRCDYGGRLVTVQIADGLLFTLARLYLPVLICFLVIRLRVIGNPSSGLFTPCDCSPSSTIGKVTSVHTRSQSQPLAGRFILQMRSCSSWRSTRSHLSSRSSLNDISHLLSHSSHPDLECLESSQIHRPPCFLGPLRPHPKYLLRPIRRPRVFPWRSRGLRGAAIAGGKEVCHFGGRRIWLLICFGELMRSVFRWGGVHSLDVGKGRFSHPYSILFLGEVKADCTAHPGCFSSMEGDEQGSKRGSLRAGR